VTSFINTECGDVAGEVP